VLHWCLRPVLRPPRCCTLDRWCSCASAPSCLRALATGTDACAQSCVLRAAVPVIADASAPVPPPVPAGTSLCIRCCFSACAPSCACGYCSYCCACPLLHWCLRPHVLLHLFPFLCLGCACTAVSVSAPVCACTCACGGLTVDGIKDVTEQWRWENPNR
jgi:hypothetical protein